MTIRHEETTEQEAQERQEQTRTKELPRTARELFDVLPELPGFRAEVIEGTLIVSPVGTPEHARCAMRLYRALMPVMDEHGWEGWTGNVDVCIEGPREPTEPDFVLAPTDCPRWGDRELLSSGLIMVAEVASTGSAPRDRNEKPTLYATGGVPIYLLIDMVAAPPTLAVYSDIRDGAYRTTTTVEVGTSLLLPHPIDVKLDTTIFTT
ncbi:Uma2 family endonuclease [Nonomuraea aurantiaca]|uniref:Uma2 family endonuclease n=1 Tax=Nonomuraea aurantiaca TaxID=2878562 RepID=UPI001CDA35CA|nr:Uma2 family endonuclease [Nonomuraea aurantiaca]MCA2219974.1 Uma2 family endonuclease [Nonomuraea aurantiaca]